MSKFNKCQELADTCMLKIEKTGLKHDYDAALMGLTKPKYVLKYRNPTYDLKVFWNLDDMYMFLNEYKNEFEKKNPTITMKRRQAWLDDYRQLLIEEGAYEVIADDINCNFKVI